MPALGENVLAIVLVPSDGVCQQKKPKGRPRRVCVFVYGLTCLLALFPLLVVFLYFGSFLLKFSFSSLGLAPICSFPPWPLDHRTIPPTVVGALPHRNSSKLPRYGKGNTGREHRGNTKKTQREHGQGTQREHWQGTQREGERAYRHIRLHAALPRDLEHG